MKPVGFIILMSLMSGCMHLRSKTPVAPPEVSAGIQFPEWTKEASTTVDGTQLKALQLAMEDFLPPGTKPPKNADAMTQCLYRIETYDAWLQRGEKMTFVHFTPKEQERCGLRPEVMDPGASYAISDDGVILKRD
ncbi:hypothetical protein [Myxococcus xanthus]|uniref:Lipoprotein n=1 Tax=Myxococcus xanthus TaxID=34 RepID=A0A7Y4IKI5_MYXXA|nr:hypothetical protein [Myxococcus xanthus]NOJ80779.1 hypothetical protein [Myxococcus xanthus]NOJ88032.1 hypothetical protein [Myxococcus xanthus]